MGKPLRSLIRHVLFRGKGNLLSLDDCFDTMKKLLAGQEVTDILDAGASDGRISRRLLRRFPQATAWAFEPHPTYTDELMAHQERDPRFRPQFVALSDQPGTIEFYETRWVGQTSRFAPSERLVKLHPHSAEARRKTSVPAVRLDDWAQQNGDPPIQVMKFDIQAGELLAMRGATRILESSALLVYTEIYFNRMHEGGALYSELDLFLRERGFVLYNIYGVRADPRDMLVYGDAIFVHAQRLNM